MLGRVSATHADRKWLAAVLLVALGLAGCGGSSSTPQATLSSFLTAWRQHDFAAMRRQVLDPPADFDALNSGALSGLGVSAPQLSAGRVRQSGSNSSAAVIERFALPAAGEWTTRTTVRLTDHKGHWLVAWTPATINPALHAGDQIELVRDWPTRAAILGAGQAPLTNQHPLVTVGVVGSRIKNRRAVSADLLAAGAPSSQIRQALAQANAHPDYFEPVFQVSQTRFEQLKNQPGPGNVYAVPGTQFELTSNRGAVTPQLGAHVVGVSRTDHRRGAPAPRAAVRRLERRRSDTVSSRPTSTGSPARPRPAWSCPTRPARRSRPSRRSPDSPAGRS